MGTPLQPGDRFAGHEILSPIGTGESADVYAARSPTGDLRALKIMVVKAGPAAKRRARFAQEGEALTLIVHPNVVRLYDAGSSDEQVWLSLELVEGETLGEKLRAWQGGGDARSRSHGPRNRPPLDDILDWIQQACDGLAEAHRVGVVHRDLTPGNLLITPSGRVKVIDFGLAKLREWGVQTTQEQQIGSARYMAPEQACSAPARPSMDVYAMGHVLYEAIAGVHAMGDEPRTLISVVAWQLSGRPRPLCDLAPDVPSDLEGLIHRALDKDPAKRPASMAAFIACLREVRARLRAPQRRAARNVPQLGKAEAFAPTIPMPAYGAAPESAPAETAPMTAVHERAAMLPDAPTMAAPPPTSTALRPAEQRLLGPVALPEVRSTDVPVETSASRASVASGTAPRRRAVGAAIAVGFGVLTALAAAGWVLLGHVPSAPWETAPAPRPAASALPWPTASVASASATASAPSAAPRVSDAGAPGAKGPVRAPAKPPRRVPSRN